MEFFLVVLAALAVIVVASLFSRRTGIATPLLLLMVGIGASYVPAVPTVHMEPEWILAGVLPPLLYASSVRLPVIDLRRNFGIVFWLSVVLVLVSAVVVGVVLHLLIPEVPLSLAIALGAVVSPTDAVAATAIGKRLGLPHRLMTILEGESLINDASALVLLRTSIAALAGSFSVWAALGDFVWAVAAAVVIGLLVGAVAVRVQGSLGDPVLIASVSFAVPWAAYFPAEELQASGVLATVVAGLTVGHSAVRRLSATQRATNATNWATVSFLMEHAVFLLMGLQVADLASDALTETTWPTILLLAAAVLATLVLIRLLGMGALKPFLRVKRARTARGGERLDRISEVIDEGESSGDERFSDPKKVQRFRRRVDRSRADIAFVRAEPLTRRGGLVIAWAGMRGVVTLAAAMTIPVSIAGEPTPYRSTVILVAFVVAVASLIGFGGTLPWLIRRLDFATRSATDKRHEMSALMNDLTDRVVDQIGPLEEQRIEGEVIDPKDAEKIAARFGPMLMALRDGKTSDPAVLTTTRQRMLVLQRRYLRAYQEALIEERSIGAYRTETLIAAQGALDREEQRLDAMG